MPNKTVYVREADVQLWEEAEELAGGNVSGLIAEALRRYVGEEKRKEEGIGPIEVQLGRRDNTGRAVRFQGMWLVDPHPDYTRAAEPRYDAGAYWGVALTKRGQFAIYCAHVNDGFDATLDTYPSLEAAEADDVPKDIIDEARRGLDPDYVEEWDI